MVNSATNIVHSSAPTQPLEVADMQGLLISAYAHLPCSSYIVLGVRDAAAARQWIGSITTRITTAEGKTDSAINIAFTLEGLRKLGVPDLSLATFPVAMQDGGMSSERRSRILGDIQSDAPKFWNWGNADEANTDVLLMIFGADDHQRDELSEQLIASSGQAFTVTEKLDSGRPESAKEHFGFLDGVGQPTIAGSNQTKRQADRTHHATEIQPGEFILGYKNQDGVLPESPMIAANSVRHTTASTAKSNDDQIDLGVNGTYLVFRQIEQDVFGFWQSVSREAAALYPEELDRSARDSKLAAKMVGRWESGAPLTVFPDQDPYKGSPQKLTENNFSYATVDPHGFGCPIGAHIRRANPRDSLNEDPMLAAKSAQRHRILRRGRSYGAQVKDRYVAEDGPRGLFFICLVADIEKQFEFIQQTWLNNPSFGSLVSEVDPIVGASSRNGCAFTIPDSPVRRRALDIKSHTQVKGGAYWFMPGISRLGMLGDIRA